MIIRDGDWTLFDYDFATRRQVWRRSNADGSDTFRVDYHVDEVLEENHHARMEAMGTRHGDWSRIASIPINTYLTQLAEAQNQLDHKYIDRFLSDHSKFKTR